MNDDGMFEHNVAALIEACSKYAAQDWPLRNAIASLKPTVVTLAPSLYEWRCHVCTALNKEYPFVAESKERVQCSTCHAWFEQAAEVAS